MTDEELYAETGGASALPGFDLEAHLAATADDDADEDQVESEAFDETIDYAPTNAGSTEPASTDDPIDTDEFVETNGDEQSVVPDADPNLDTSSDSIDLPPVGSPAYEALMFETGGAAANDGFNYQAHLAATGQLGKLEELVPDYDPDLDPIFDEDYEAPFDESSPESSIDRAALANAESLEDFIAAANGVDVGALGALLTPAEIAEVIEKFGSNPEFDAYVSSSVPTPGPVGPGEFDPGPIAPPSMYVPPEEKLGLIRGDDLDDKKGAVLELFSEAGDFDAFASGLAASLSQTEIDALIADLADDEEVWATLGIDMPVMPGPTPGPVSNGSSISLPPVGSAEYEALMFETGGAAANDGFNYQAHLAATGQLDKLVELNPDYDPDLDPIFDADFEAPFDESSPESTIDRAALASAESLEDFIAAANGVDVGALGALLTPAEIAEVIEKFGNDPEFDAYVSSSVPTPAPVGPGEFDPEFVIPPTAYMPPEEKLGQIRDGGLDDKKAAVLELFTEAGDFDAFASGLASSLSPEEIDALIADLAGDAEVWNTLGIAMPVIPQSGIAGSETFDSRFEDIDDAIAFAEANGQGPLTVGADGTITNQFGEVMVYDSEGNLAPGGIIPDAFETALPGEVDPGFIAPPPTFIPPEEALGLIRGGGRDDKKGAVLELFGDAGSFDAFASGLASTLSPIEIDALIADLADDAEVWEILGMEMPILAPPAESLEPVLDQINNISVTMPDFIPRAEDLQIIRGDDKETKKVAIFDLLDESGSVDSFLSGLGGALEADEIDLLAREFADDIEIWEVLGIPQPIFDDFEAITGLSDIDDSLTVPSLNEDQTPLDGIDTIEEVGVSPVTAL